MSDRAERPLNWRSALGSFWQDLGAIGEVIGARRLQELEERVERLESELKRLAARNVEPAADG